MDQSEKASVPPEQNEGIKKDLEERVSFDDVEDAEEMFVIGKERLLHVNEWHKVTESLGAKFQIVDSHGHPAHRHVHAGDYITIEIPGPGSVTGDGRDWVTVEAIEYDDYPDENRELLAMRVRPVPNPLGSDDSVAHFFKDDATSTFIIERDHNMVITSYHGRNEQQNTRTEKLADKVRNTVVGISAILGFSDVQWGGLIKGLLKIED